MNSIVLLQQMGMILLLVLTGVFLYKKHIVDDHGAKNMSALVVDLCNPATILSTVLSGNIKTTHREFLTAVAAAIILYAAMALFGYILPYLIRAPKKDRNTYNLMTAFTNVGFMGIPVARAVLDDSAMIYVVLCIILFNVLFYTLGIHLLSNGKEKTSLRSVLMNPGVIMSVIALVVFWFDLSLPPILANTVIYIGNATVFLSMALLGISLARQNLRGIFRNAVILRYIIVRMILFPIACVLVMRALHLPEIMTQTFCLMATMPVANLPLIQAEKMGLDTDLLSRNIMITTLVSFLTITLVMSIMF